MGRHGAGRGGEERPLPAAGHLSGGSRRAPAGPPAPARDRAGAPGHAAVAVAGRCTAGPERTPGDVASPAGGLAAAVAVVVLPSIVAHDADGIKGRFAVAAAIGGAGLASFFAQRSAPPLDVVAGANAAARDAAKRRLEDVRRQNAKALAEIRLRVRAGPATLLEQGAQ